jgi:diacylglycerol kinase family enzyme
VRRILIVNPAASRVTPARVRAVEAELRTGGPLETVLTERAGQAGEIAAAASRECEQLYVYAGDGGFNEAANGVRGDVAVGFVPGGATSVLPRALGLPRDAVAAARRLARSRQTRRISLGRIRRDGEDPGRRFTFSAGLGLDAELVRAVDARGRRDGRRPGDLAFVWELGCLLARHGWRLEPAIEVEGHGRCAFVVASNCDPYTYAGRIPVRATPLARFELGLDVAGVGRLRPQGIPRLAWWLLARPSHPLSDEVVYLHDTDGVRLTCARPLPLQVDGEDLGDATEVVVAAERDALTVIV